MNKRLGLFLVSIISILVIVFVNSPLIFAQEKNYDWCQISAYATDLVENSGAVGGFGFVVAVPPNDSEIPNTILAHNLITDENYTINLLQGEVIQINYFDFDVISINLNAASEPGHFTIFYEGEAGSITINTSQIPEFASILIAPMFIAVTLLALIYRRKNKT